MLLGVKFNGVLPTFVKVTSLGALVVPMSCFPKDSFVGASETTVPIPVSATACGLAGSESLITRTPLPLPTTVGVKIIEIVQLAPGPIAASQSLVWVKSPVFLPVI